MNPVIIQIFAYLLVWVLSLLFFNFLSNGFLVKWIRVKASRGRFVLIELDGVAEYIWVLGKINDNHLRWKSGGEHKSLIITREDIYRKYGAKCITIDAETNAIRRIDWSVAEKVDAEAYDDKLQRAVEAPEITNKNEKVLIILAIVILVLLSVYNAWTLTAIKELLTNGSTNVVGVVN